jgi:hypothetical protein
MQDPNAAADFQSQRPGTCNMPGITCNTADELAQKLLFLVEFIKTCPYAVTAFLVKSGFPCAGLEAEEKGDQFIVALQDAIGRCLTPPGTAPSPATGSADSAEAQAGRDIEIANLCASFDISTILEDISSDLGIDWAKFGMYVLSSNYADGKVKRRHKIYSSTVLTNRAQRKAERAMLRGAMYAPKTRFRQGVKGTEMEGGQLLPQQTVTRLFTDEVNILHIYIYICMHTYIHTYIYICVYINV